MTTDRDDPSFGMRVLTRSLDDWADAWLVELEAPIKPMLKSYEEYGNGVIRVDEVAIPSVRHVVVNHEVVHEDYEETNVYPAFASGQYRGVGEGKEALAGGPACTHVDALHDLAEGYVGLECTIDGDRCPYAIGTNQVILHD